MTLLNELKKFAYDCTKDKILSCKKHKWACDRFLKDLERQSDNDFGYYFDEEPANRFLAYSKLFKYTKGTLVGKNITLHPSLNFISSNIYGWRRKDDHTRRFIKAYVQVARKNGKSLLASLIGGYETLGYLQNGEISEVYCAATKRDQALIVYDETVNMLRSCELLKGKWFEKYNKLIHKKTGSFMRPLTREDKTKADGFNPQCAVIDEYHAHTSSSLLDIMSTGMGARNEPLLFIITTAGLDLNSPCYRNEYKTCSDILNPDNPAVSDHYFIDIYELDSNESSEEIEVDGVKIPPGHLIDDPFNERVWPKSNPVICSYDKGVQNLRNDANDANLSADNMRSFLTKRLNIWVNMRESGYMSGERWAACKAEIPDLSGLSCYIGIDLAAKEDLCSVAFEFIVNGQYVIFSHSFTPESAAERRIKENIPFDLWQEQGWLTIVDGSVIDNRVVKDYINNIVSDKNWIVESINIDPWQAHQLSGELIEDGYTVNTVPQSIKCLSEPTKDLRAQVKMNNVLHDGNPVLSWGVGNAVVLSDNNENIRLCKDKSKDKIDTIAAVINAHYSAMTEEVYNVSDLISVI